MSRGPRPAFPTRELRRGTAARGPGAIPPPAAPSLRRPLRRGAGAPATGRAAPPVFRAPVRESLRRPRRARGTSRGAPRARVFRHPLWDYIVSECDLRSRLGVDCLRRESASRRPRWCSGRPSATPGSSPSTVRRPSPLTIPPGPRRRIPQTPRPTMLTWPRQSPLCRVPRRRVSAPTTPGRTVLAKAPVPRPASPSCRARRTRRERNPPCRPDVSRHRSRTHPTPPRPAPSRAVQ
jgi:hypothetical protein